MEVAAVTGQVTERLGHEGGDQAALLSERLDHVAKEDRPVAGREGVGEVEVLLELAVRVLVVGGVVVPAEPGDVARNLGHEVEVARERAHVVAGLLEGVERIGQLDRAVLALAHEEVLELGADHELVAHRARALEHVAQDRPRTVGPRLAVHRHVARQAGDVRPPRQRGERANVGHRRDVGIVGTLADRPGGESGEARAVLEQPVEVARRHQLGVRLAVHVDELGEEELHVVLTEVALDVLAGARRGEGLVHGPNVSARPGGGQCGGPPPFAAERVHTDSV